MLDVALYDRETLCDWTSGSFMLAGRAAIDDVGGMDDRFPATAKKRMSACQRTGQDGSSSIFLR